MQVQKKSCIFAAEIKRMYMTTVQLNADILRNLGAIAKNETMLDRVAKYLRRMAKQLTDDPTCMTREEYFSRLDEAERQIAEGRGVTFTNASQMNAWLNAL